MILLLVGGFGVGLLLLAKASDYFVVGSARLATGLRVSPVFIGVAVIGFGTSAPELLVSGLAAAQGSTELAIGNVVGSNVANMTLVLGTAGLLAVVPVRSAVLRWEAPLSVAAVLAFAVLVPGGLNLVDGVVLLGLLVVALWLLLRAALAGKGEMVDAMAGEVAVYVDGTVQHSLRAEVVRTGVGLVGTLAGAQLLVWGASGLAARLGVPPEVIGFTLVAIGTSLPELVTGAGAAPRRTGPAGRQPAGQQPVQQLGRWGGDWPGRRRLGDYRGSCCTGRGDGGDESGGVAAAV